MKFINNSTLEGINQIQAKIEAQNLANESKQECAVINVHGYGYAVVEGGINGWKLGRNYYHGKGGKKMFFDLVKIFYPKSRTPIQIRKEAETTTQPKGMTQIISWSLSKPKNDTWQIVKANVHISKARKFSDYLTNEGIPHRSKLAEGDEIESFKFEYMKGRNNIPLEEFIDNFVLAQY